MGEVQSSPASMNRFVEGEKYLHKHTLMEQISEDIAAGNEGDILDMQCKMLMEHDLPHLWESHESVSTRSSDSEIEMERDVMMEGPLRFERNIMNKSKTMPNMQLRESYHKESMDEFMDEDMFKTQLMKSHSAPMQIMEGAYDERDSYEEFLMKLVEWLVVQDHFQLPYGRARRISLWSNEKAKICGSLRRIAATIW